MFTLTIPARSQTGEPGAQTPASQAPDDQVQSPQDRSPQTPASEPAPPIPPSELKPLRPAELDALVAPVALYPDTLLANVFMAATYPLEVVQAERWINQNKALEPDALKVAVEKQDWDASIKALAAAPPVLQMMSDHLDWMQKLGETFLAQQQDVMDAVQRMRGRAYDRNQCVTTKEQVVTVTEDQNRRMIYIEPAVTGSIYVPYYEPQVVYGEWPYSDYPPYPYYWGYPSYIGAGIIATGVAFGAAYALGRWASGGYWGGAGYWGASRVNWRGGTVDVNRGARVEHWQHNPVHRQGARYTNAALQQRFGNVSRRTGAERQGLTGANRDRGDRPTGAGRSAGNRQATSSNRSASARNVRQASAGRRPLGAAAPQAGRFKSGAGARQGGARFAGGAHRAVAMRAAGGSRPGGGVRAGGGFRGGGARGGARRSDIRLKHDVILIGRLDNGLGYYRFAYNGSGKLYVGVIAQEVRKVRPDAVFRGRDGYLRVSYQRLGLQMQAYDDWLRSGPPRDVGRVLSTF